MPDIIAAYFDADSRNDGDALMQTFNADAVVKDEGARHAGIAAIRTWWSNAKAATQYVAEPLEAVADDDETCVRARVSGPFAGSPVTLSYAFTVEDGKIARLEIL